MRKYLWFALPLVPVIAVGCSKTTAQPPAPAAFVMPTEVPQAPAPPAAIPARPVAIPLTKLPRPNGHDLLNQAALSIQRDKGPYTRLPPDKELERARAHVGRNAEPLGMMRRALKMPIMTPPKRGLVVFRPRVGNPRELARLAMDENSVHAAEGRWDLAAQGALDIVAMGVALQSGAGLMDNRVGASIEALGRGDVLRWRDKLDAAQSSAAAKQLEYLEATRPSYAAMVQAEMWESLSETRAMFQEQSWKKFRAGDRDAFKMFRDPQDTERLSTVSDQQIEANLVATMQAAVARARLPYSPSLPAIAPPADPLSAQMTKVETSPRLSQFSRMSHARNDAGSRLLATALALQGFELSTGKAPQSLDELVSKYLKAVPRDPFAPAHPLRYKRDGDNFVLYSVGPDGVDDSGNAVKNQNISPDTRGDLLVGSIK